MLPPTLCRSEGSPKHTHKSSHDGRNKHVEKTLHTIRTRANRILLPTGTPTSQPRPKRPDYGNHRSSITKRNCVVSSFFW